VILSVGKAWDETKDFLAREGRLVVPVALATFALPSVLAGWAYPQGNPGSGGGSGLLLLLAVLVAVIVGQMTIALMATGWSGRIGDAMSKVARRLPTLLLALLMVFLPISLVAVVVLGGALSGAGLTDPTAMTAEALAKVPSVGWIILVLMLVFIFASARLFPISAIAATEPVGPIQLLKRSWVLTRGNFGRLLALMLLLLLVAVILDLAVSLTIGSVAALALGEAKAFNLSALVVALASGLVGAAVSSVSASMVGRVYVQLAGEKT